MSVQGRPLQNPFPGLRPFEPDEDYLFFGREEQTIELLGRLAENRFVAVVGTSGSGKSSLVRCGLLSELLGGKLRQAGAAWEIAVTHPGGNPLALLAESLLEADLYDRQADHARENLLATLSRSHFGLVEAVKQSDIGDDTNFLLVVDQFEEIFRFHEAGQAQKEVANEFVSLLLEAVTQLAVPIYVVLTMRSDFIGECGQFEGLAEMVNRGEFLIPRLNREQYKRVIEGPVKVAGGEITPRLLQRLLNDLGQQADQLPCLQHALMRTWNVWSESGGDGAIDLDDYQRVGKMTQALSLHADEVYDSLASDRQRELCRGLFQALTVQESENRGIRRPQRLDRLCQILEVGADELAPVIGAYRQSGVTFLMPSPDVELTERTIIDISHESLMRVWTRLRYWVEEEAQAAGIYRRLSESAALHGQGEAGLYRDPELGIALAWKQEKCPNQAWAERYRAGFDSAMKFLQESEQAARAEAAAREAARQRELSQAKELADVQRRSARRLRWLVSGLAVVALFAVVATINAVRARRVADDATIAALASEDLALENADRAKREAAHALAQEAAAKKAEEAATAAKSEAEAATDAFEQQLYLSDMTLADHSYDEGNVGRVTQMLLDHVPAVDAADDPRGFEWFHLWAGAHRVSKTFRPGRGGDTDTQPRFGVPLLALAVSPGGDKGAAGYRDGVAIFDARTHEVLDVVDQGSPIRRNACIALGFTPDGTRLAAVTEEGELRVWDANTYASVRQRTTSTLLRGVAFSATEPLLASGGLDGYVYLWDTESWEQLELSESVGLPIVCLAFSPDGTRLALGTQSATSDSEEIQAGRSRLVLWDVANRETIKSRQDHEGTIHAVTWSADGKSVASGAADGTVRIWDYDLNPLETVSATAPVQTISFSPDGSLLAAGVSRNNTVRIVATDTWEPVTDLKGQSSSISAVAFVADSEMLLAGGDDGQLQVWDVAQAVREPVETVRDEPLRKLLRRSQRAWIGGDGPTLYCWSSDAPISRYDLAARKMLPAWNDGEPYSLVELSEGGEFLAAINSQHELSVWESGSGEPLTQIQVSTEGNLHDLTISRDGSRVAWLTGSREVDEGGDREAGVLDIPSGERVEFTYGSWGGSLQHLSPDGGRLAARRVLNVSLYDLEDLTTSSVGDSPPFTSMADANVPHRIVYSPDGAISASLAASMIGGRIANSAKGIALHDREGELLHNLQGHSGQVNCGTFSPDGRRFISGGQDGTIRVWDVQNGDLLLTLRGHGGSVDSLAFVRDGRSLVSLSRSDGRVRIWQAPTARELESDVTYWAELADHLVNADDLVGARNAYGEASKRTSAPLEFLRLRANLGLAMGLNRSVVDDYMRVIAMGGADTDLIELTSSLAGLEPVVANTEDQLLTWRYTFNVPRAGWNQPSFDASDWELGRSPMGNERGDRTAWSSTDIWLRLEFDLEQVPQSLTARAWNDDTAEFYINGVLARTRTYSGRNYSEFDLLPEAAAALQVGRNVLAIHCLDTGGATRRIDAGLYVDRGQPGWIERLTDQLAEDADNVHLLQARMTAYEQASDDERAKADARHLLTLLEKDVKAEMAEADSRASEKVEIFARATVKAARDDTDWKVLSPFEMQTAEGATLTKLPDDSILASGDNPTGEVYTIVARPSLEQIGAIRLEALTHPSLPDNGPGRAAPKAVGVFAMTGWRVSSVPENETGEELRIQSTEAWADHTMEPDDDVSGGHWNTTYGAGKSHLALFRVHPPVPFTKGNLLRFTMSFSGSEDWPGQNLGRFRLSVAGDPDAYDREKVVQTMQLSGSGWSDLAAAYHLVGNEQALDALLAVRPEGAAGLADLFARQGNWRLALEGYNRAVNPDQPDPDLLVARSRAYHHLGEFELADADLHKAVELHPNPQSAFDVFREREDWRTSAAFGWRLVEVDPTDSNVWLRLAPVLLLAGDRDGYRKLCEHVLAQETILSDAGEASRAAKICLLMPEAADVSKIDAVLIRQAIDNGERDDRWRIWTWSSLALLAYREGDAAAALNHLESASAEGETSDNQQALLLAVRSLALIQLSRYAEAESDVDTATELIEELADSVSVGGIHDLQMPQLLLDESRQVLTARQRQIEKWVSDGNWQPLAEDSLKSLEAMEDTRRAAYGERARWLRSVIQRGDGLFDAMIKIQPQNTELHLAKARELALSEQWDDAADVYAQAVVDTPDTEEYYEYAATLLLAGRESDYRQVVTDLAAVTQRSGSPEDQYAAARAATLVPQSPVDPNQVVEWARQAVEAQPQPWRHHLLGLALFRAGELDEATELLEAVRNETNWGRNLKDIGLCLIQLQRGDIEAARGYRSETQAWFEQTAEARAEGRGRVQPTDWLEMQVLLREADARLNP